MRNALIQTSGCYAAVYDEGAASNRAYFVDEVWALARGRTKDEGLEDFYSLFFFNDHLIRAARQGEMLAWTLLFDGVFAAHAQYVSDAIDHGELLGTRGDEGALPSQGVLSCPTGRLIVSCLSKLGSESAPLLVVEPGNYHVSISRDEGLELDHTLLGSLDAYPSGDPPDWIFRVQRITGSAA